MREEKAKLEASNDEKVSCIATLEVELKQAKEEYEAEINKVRRSSDEVAVDVSAALVKIGQLNDEVNHTRQLNENYRSSMTNCYTLGNK